MACGVISLWGALLLSVGGAQAAEWDITDTGQPYHDVEFTVSEGTWMSVDVSPTGGRLVFDLLGDLYVMPASGGAATLLHGGADVARTPSFSDDGEKVMFLSDLSGSDNVWTINRDGTALKPLTRENAVMLAGPEWGPGGDYIAAVQQVPTFDDMKSSEVRMFHLSGGSGRTLVPAPANGRDVQEIDFSPDGRFVYYTERVTSPHIYVDANQVNHVIRRRNLATGVVETIIEGFGGAITPQLSDDGNYLAFIRRVRDKTVLFSYNIETREQRPVYDDLDRDAQADFVPHGVYYPQFDWFPDNRHVAIWGKGRLYKVNIFDGAATEIPFTVRARHRLTKVARTARDLAPEEFTVRAIRQIALSPDGGAVTASALGNLWQKNLPDGKAARVTEAGHFEFEPAYSADGQWLAHVAWDDEKGSALTLTTPGGDNPEVLATSPGVIREPAFSPDGRYLVYRIEDGNKIMGGYTARGGLYLVAVTGGASRRIGDAAGTRPQFTPDSCRILYSIRESTDQGRITRLESVTLNGLGRRIHAVAQGADRSDLRLSPDMRWLAFREEQQYYVMPYLETGAPLVAQAKNAAVPVAKLTELGGDGLTWAAGSGYLAWTLGEEIYRLSVDDFFDGAEQMPALARFDIRVKGDRPEGRIVLTGARIITMRGNEIIEPGTVVIEGNRITALGRTEDVTIPDGAKVIELAGHTIMPGLVDMHGHIDCCYYGGLIPQQQPTHFAAAAFGITTNFDPYTSELASYSATEMQGAGIQVGPRFLSSGKVIYGRRGKGDVSYHPIDGYGDALKIMQRKNRLGGSFIKSYKQPTRAKRQQLVKAGRDTGIMVDVEGESHFYNNISMILDGHMALEHNLPLAHYYDDLIKLMAHSGMANTPTLIVTFAEIMGENYMYQNSRGWEDPKVKTFVQETTSGYSPLMAPYSAPVHVRNMQTLHAADEIWNIGVKAVSRATKKLDDAGVIVNAGSHGQIPGLALHWEMQLMAEGGMSNFNILRAATLNGARTLGLDQQIGSLDVGKLADIIVLAEDPLADIKNTNSVTHTMINGRLYDAYTMNEVGNYDRPRRKFYWETIDTHGIDWNPAWAGQ